MYVEYEKESLEETQLIKAIESIEADYRRAIKPYVDRLIQIRNCKVPKYIITLEELSKLDIKPF